MRRVNSLNSALVNVVQHQHVGDPVAGPGAECHLADYPRGARRRVGRARWHRAAGEVVNVHLRLVEARVPPAFLFFDAVTSFRR